MSTKINLTPINTLVITGSSGFVGENLAVAAHNLGFNVIGIDQRESPRLKCQQFIIDLASEDISHLIPEGATIVHLASLSTDSSCRENPILAVDVNLKATTLLVDAANKARASQLIFASSEWVYPERKDPLGQLETDILSLTDLKSLYAISKLIGESLIRTTSGIPFSLLRFGIVYGPRAIPGSAAESLALKVLNNEKIQVGSANTARRFIYIDDLVEAILKVVAFGAVSNDGIPLNIAGSQLISLADVVTTTNNIYGKSIRIIDGGNSPSIRNPLIERAHNMIGWQPYTAFSEGILKCLNVMSN